MATFSPNRYAMRSDTVRNNNGNIDSRTILVFVFKVYVCVCECVWMKVTIKSKLKSEKKRKCAVRMICRWSCAHNVILIYRVHFTLMVDISFFLQNKCNDHFVSINQFQYTFSPLDNGIKERNTHNEINRILLHWKIMAIIWIAKSHLNE